MKIASFLILFSAVVAINQVYVDCYRFKPPGTVGDVERRKAWGRMHLLRTGKRAAWAKMHLLRTGKRSEDGGYVMEDQDQLDVSPHMDFLDTFQKMEEDKINNMKRSMIIKGYPKRGPKVRGYLTNLRLFKRSGGEEVAPLEEVEAEDF